MTVRFHGRIVRPRPEDIAAVCPDGTFLGVNMRSTSFAVDLAAANKKFWRDVDRLSPDRFADGLVAVKFPPRDAEQDS